MKMRHIALVASLMALALPSAVWANTTCTLTSSSVSFGAYNPISGPGVDITGTVTLTCDKGNTDYEILLSTGNSGDYSNRKMSYAGNRLPYQLYLDSAHAITWGDGTGGTGTIIGTLPKKQTTISFTVYGRVRGGENVIPGFYTDTIVATANYK